MYMYMYHSCNECVIKRMLAVHLRLMRTGEGLSIACMHTCDVSVEVAGGDSALAERAATVWPSLAPSLHAIACSCGQLRWKM